ncbi:MAG TPA: hypothetical protein VHY32_10525 [Caulobacteraceae bacterium]|nr:hypothetical protein [Caulobacteraceae bacterium]
MSDDPRLRDLREKRSFLGDCLRPLESGRLASGESAANRARSHFLRREISELDALIARGERRGP